jgi:hypothetical protein
MKTKTPLPIILFGGFLAVFGILVAVSGFFNIQGVGGLDGLAPDFKTNTAANQLVAFMYSGRALTMAGVMIIALILQNKRVLAVAFLMRMGTELLDTIAVVGVGATPTPTRFVMAGLLVVLAVLEAVCAWKLWQMADTESRQAGQ